MNCNDVRSSYLDFFVEREHRSIPSSPLIPRGDPTLLFTSAGMVQFKQQFLGQVDLGFYRAASCQKCFRTSDIDRVGVTARHDTFFEMLGNFSFGDYFKKEAIAWGIEYVEKTLGLPRDRLFFSVFRDDDEAFDLWRSHGVPAERLVRLGEDDNFWKIGETGPCGPCSEIYYDLGEEFGCKRPECAPGCDCDRYLEIWNLVFTQFDRQADGTLVPLPRKNVDTGMGLERTALVMQGVDSIYDTDLMLPIIRSAEEISGKDHKDPEYVAAFRVVADHLRAGVFLISEGLLPSNEGRGYVLRRLLRRTARFGRVLGLEEPFQHRIVDSVVGIFDGVYPDLKERQDMITKVIHLEEERFNTTLQTGTGILEDLIRKAKDSGASEIAPADAFRLYDTYGFPLELTEEIAGEAGLSVDTEGFASIMAEQRERAKAAWKGSGEAAESDVYAEVFNAAGVTEFTGYDELETGTEVTAVVREGELVDQLESGDEGEIVLKRTPLYGEAGGQVGDTGVIEADGARFEVSDTQRTATGLFLHIGRMTEGSLAAGMGVTASVDTERRGRIARNHTATHVLHYALRTVLGSHVAQAGSMVAPDRLRFDYSHFEKPTAEQLSEIELIANQQLWRNVPVRCKQTTIGDAREEGAIALFEEKYGEKVRMISTGDFSKELCGGTHADSTGGIAPFKIISESSVAAGMRRIEALTGEDAYRYIKEQESALHEAARALAVPPAEVTQRLDALLAERKAMEKALEEQRAAQASGTVGDLLAEAHELDGIPLVARAMPDLDRDGLLQVADALREKIGSGVAVLGGTGSGKAVFVCLVTKDLTDRLHAGKIIKEVAKIAGGGGGGRPDLAQAGGKDPEKVSDAIAAAPDIVQGFLI